MLKLPKGSFKAYLFDCDGTIADSMPLHYRAWKKALSEWKCEFEEGLFYEWGGMPVAKIISTLNKRDGLEMPVESVSRRRKGSFCRGVGQHTRFGYGFADGVELA